MLWRALTSKQFALMRLKHSFQHFTTLSCLRICNANPRNAEGLFGIPRRKLVAHSQGRLGDEPETSPFKIGPQLEDLAHSTQRRPVPLPGNDSLVLVFDLGLACFELPQEHYDRLKQVQRLEPAHNDWFVLVLSDPLIRTTTDHSGDVPRANERIQGHMGGI